MFREAAALTDRLLCLYPQLTKCEVMSMFYGGEIIDVYDGHTDSALVLRRQPEDDVSGLYYSYRLGTLPLPDGAYTFTVWAKAMVNMSLSVDMLGECQAFVLPAGEWTKIEIYCEEPARGEDDHVRRYIDLTPAYNLPLSYGEDDNNDLYLYQAMLELSNSASDWVPAPEDSEAVENQLIERISAAELKLEDDSIVSTVMQSETYQNDMDQMRNTISSSITQLSDSVTIEFNNVNETYGDTKTFVDTAKVYQTFDANGIHLGKEGDPFTMDLSSTELAFNDNGNKVAYINNQTMHITNAEVLSRFVIGKFAFVPTDTGMALIYVGDE